MPDQGRPAAGGCVAGGDDRDREWPIDRKIRIVVRDPKVLGGIMRPIDAIAHIGERGQRLEAVQKSGRHKQMPKVVVVEQECLLFAKGRRRLANVDQYIVHRAVGAADQLRFPTARASVHAPDDAHGRAGLRVLHERGGASRLAEIVVEYLCVKGPGEQPSLIAERLRDEDENVGESGSFDAHGVMLS